ncbi:crossover junction endodeoxyribonuclease RuvC [Myxococcota bacterium]|nr:crossover junction endodeoxyribonuclease RuvC [Myxococcota bacterium]
MRETGQRDAGGEPKRAGEPFPGKAGLRILGIDPGSTATGFGIVERRGGRVVHIAHGTLRTARGAALSDRLAAIQAGLLRAIDAHQPEIVVVERIFAGRSARSALVLGHARGVALVSAALAGLVVLEYTAPEIKLAVAGNGAAEKRQVQAMVARLLELAVPPARDAADALAAALCHAHRGPLAALGVAAGSRSRPRRAPTAGRWVVRRAR